MNTSEGSHFSDIIQMFPLLVVVSEYMSLCTRGYRCVCCVSGKGKRGILVNSCHSSSDSEFKSSSLQPRRIWGSKRNNAWSPPHITFPFNQQFKLSPSTANHSAAGQSSAAQSQKASHRKRIKITFAELTGGPRHGNENLPPQSDARAICKHKLSHF